MKRSVTITYIFACFLLLTSGVVRAQNRQESLDSIAQTKSREFESASQRVLDYLSRSNEPLWFTDIYGNRVQIVDIDQFGKPVYRSTSNQGAALSTGASSLNVGGSSALGLNGTGITIGVWDSGPIFAHTEFGARGEAKDGGTISDHGTHVSGSIVSAGINPVAKGMAPDASLVSYNWDNDLGEMAELAKPDETTLLFSNHSYGLVQGWFLNSAGRWQWAGASGVSSVEDYRFGYYSNVSKSLDDLAFNAPFYSIFWAVGNDRDDVNTTGPSQGNFPPDCNGGTGFDCIATEGTAKNIFTIGAIRKVENYRNASDVIQAAFSNWGPTDDGRIKPDLVAPGVDIFSTISSLSGSTTPRYGTLSGTSMASPVALGSLALLQQYHIRRFGRPMRSATLKALAIHTAKEAGPGPGPDYMNGWGLVDVASAANVLKDAGNSETFIQELTLNEGATYEFRFATALNSKISATIAWTDPAGTTLPIGLDNPGLMLVNDLDVRLVDDLGNEYFPWTLNPDVGVLAATQVATKGDNFRDNVEKLEFENAEPRHYTLRVRHKGTLRGGSQNFSLVLTFKKTSSSEPILYWVGGSGSWNDPANWSLTSNGTPAGVLPGTTSRVVFDERSLADNDVIEIPSNQTISSLIWLNKSRGALDLSSSTLTILNDFTVTGSSLTITDGTVEYLRQASGNTTLNFNRTIFSNATAQFRTTAATGGWTLVGAPSLDNLKLVSGNLTVSSADTVIVSNVDVSGAAARTLDLRDAKLNKVKSFLVAGTNVEVLSSQKSFISGNKDNAGTFAFGTGKFRGGLWLNGTNSTVDAADSVAWVKVNADAVFSGSAIIDSLFVSGGVLLKVQAGTTLTLGNVIVQSTATNRSRFESTSETTKASLGFPAYKKSCFDFLDIKGVDITGQGIVNAGASSTLTNALNWRKGVCSEILFPNFEFRFNCVKSLVEFTDVSTGSIISRTWQFQGASLVFGSDATVARAVFDQGTSVNVTLTVRNGSSQESYTKAVSLRPNTVATNAVTLNGNNLISTQTGTSYQWFRNEAVIENQTGRVFNFGGNFGSYLVAASDGTCNSPSPLFNITSIEDAIESSSLVHPNPTPGSIIINAENLPGVLTVVDVAGRVVFQKNVSKTEPLVDLSQLTDGLYIITVSSQDRVVSSRLVIRR